jgi:hypothetical protein
VVGFTSQQLYSRGKLHRYALTRWICGPRPEAVGRFTEYRYFAPVGIRIVFLAGLARSVVVVPTVLYRLHVMSLCLQREYCIRLIDFLYSLPSLGGIVRHTSAEITTKRSLKNCFFLKVLHILNKTVHYTLILCMLLTVMGDPPLKFQRCLFVLRTLWVCSTYHRGGFLWDVMLCSFF